jgi:hypothetical protein
MPPTVVLFRASVQCITALLPAQIQVSGVSNDATTRKLLGEAKDMILPYPPSPGNQPGLLATRQPHTYGGMAFRPR